MATADEKLAWYKAELERRMAYASSDLHKAATLDALRLATDGLYQVLRDMRMIEVAPVVRTPPKAPEAKPDVEAAKDHQKLKPSVRPPTRIEPFIERHSQSRNDCGVVAIANILQIPHREAKVLMFTHGWSSVRGYANGILEVVLQEKGWELSHRKDLVGYSTGELARRMPDGVFVVLTQDYVMAGINGKLYNLAGTDLHRVIDVIELHRN
jgi:hypothetical protein